MTRRFAALHFAHFLVSVPLVSMPLAAAGQSNTFDIVVEGKRIGKDVYTIDKDKKGFHAASRLTVRAGGVDQDLSGDYAFDENYAFKSLTITSHTQTATFFYTANKAQTQLDIILQTASRVAGGITIFPDLMFLSPFDPAALQVALLLAVTHPAKDDMYDAYVPSFGGGGGGGRRGSEPPAADVATAGTEPAGIPYHAKWFKGGDSGGKLDGKATLLHTYLLGYGRARYYLYADLNNQLMEVDLPGVKTSYVRANFQLNAAPAAAATAHH